MDIKRIILYIALAAVGFALWNAWEKEHPPATAVANQTNTMTSANVPPLSAQEQAQTNVPPASTATNPTVPAAPAHPGQQMINVTTDVLNIGIDTLGGSLIKSALPKYPVSVQTPNQPVQLLDSNPNSLFIAQSGLIGPDGPDTQEGQAVFTSAQSNYHMSADQNQLDVQLTWQNKDGVSITKTYTFYRGKYNVGLSYQITNHSSKPWSGQFYTQLRRVPPQVSHSIFALHTFTGAAISSANEPYEKLTFSKLAEQNLNRTIEGGWLAMQERYFLTVWIPPQNASNHYYSSTSSDQTYTLGAVGPKINVAPGNTTQVQAKFYTGPQIGENLKPLAPHLELTIDYGWLWPISVAIFWVMKHIYNWIGNWGWSIVLVTLLIKLLFYKLSETSYRSMAKMRKLTPRLQAIKDRYGDDRQKLSQATMELYRKEKVNPLSGCLPILVQIPFFIALYYVLVESVELRQAPFIWWIKDLSTYDPFYVLPILMGISMFLQQKLNPPPPDPMQAKIMMLLPIVFTVFFLAFPAGLVLYWLVNNCIGVAQQWHIIRSVEKSDSQHKHK